MSYVGNTPTTQSFIAGTDYFNGTGSQTAFTLSRNVVSANDIQATVNNVVQQPNDAYTVSGTTITFTSAPSAGTQNVYVRYLSTTTQSITPSQNTVSYSTLNSDNQSKLGISFKNRIINGACVIDQRNAGASVTITNTAALTYTLDRWASYGSVASKFSVQQDAGAVTPPVGFNDYLGVTSLSAYTVGSSEVFKVTQVIEGYNTADLAWGTVNAKTVTLSFWVRSSLTGTFGGAIVNGAFNRNYPFNYTINAANTWEYKTITITGDTTGTWNVSNVIGMQVIWSLGTGASLSGAAGAWAPNNIQSATGATSVLATNGATWYITGVQLEVGTQATTFDYRPYGTELALCQRYFQVAGGNGAYPRVITSSTANDRYLGGSWGYVTTMRASPTLTQLGNWSYQNVVTTLTFDTTGTDGFLAYSTSTNGNVVIAGFFPTDATGKLTFSAEL